jgi:uncharacterized integral membrane protein
MLEFECPECGEVMEISDRMTGKQVRCVECDELVEVHPEPRRRRRKRRPMDPGLSSTEWILFILLFVFVPIANVLVSSILYYVWRSDKPRRASQINLLGFAVFGFHVLLYIMFTVILAAGRR